MAGNTPYSEEKLRATAEYFLRRQPHRSSSDLAHLCFQVDFSAYRRLGRSITGAQWRRGRSTPYIAEAPSLFRDVVRANTPTWLRALGWLAVAYVILTARKVARRRLEAEVDDLSKRLLAYFRVPGPLRREMNERQREELARAERSARWDGPV